MWADYFLMAINSIRHRKLRSWLTVIGIIIGVAAIISLVTVSRSLESTIESQFEQFGANRILISPKGFQGPGTSSEGLTTQDLETVEKISGFKYVIPGLFISTEVRHKDEVEFTLIASVPAENFEEFFLDSGIELQEGRFIEEGDKFEAVVGSRVIEDMFDSPLKLGSKIEIKGEEFKIVGVLKEIGNSQDDNQINIPLETAREIFNKPDDVDVIVAQVKVADDIPLLQEKIERELEDERDDTNFQVVTATQILEQINEVLGIIQFVLVGIAAISLIVGGIGIMNSMYTSVLERTKDIGIMKAIGAKNLDIFEIFLIESGLIGLVGGFFGTILGSVIALVIGEFSKNAGFLLNIKIEFLVLVFGLFFAFVAGMLSGVLPAMQAARLKPADALRYE
ncbi:MAG TPA: ABC transporter permease [Candidatus Nanoarchaeia archaeon]|nr:ABC transporter permease [Candidatus Nanoarchaeia archaeon]